MRKYAFTDEVKVVDGRTLRRIVAVRAIPRYLVRRGDLGGFVEADANLSHEGDCWVAQAACVFDKAVVRDSAYCGENSRIYGGAELLEGCCVVGRCRVFGDARIAGKAVLMDDAVVCGACSVSGMVMLTQDSGVGDLGQVYGLVQMGGAARVCGTGKVGGCTVLDGFTTISAGEWVDNEKVK